MNIPSSISDNWDTELFDRYNDKQDEAAKHYDETLNSIINTLRENNLLVNVGEGVLKIRSCFNENEEDNICIDCNKLVKTVDKYSLESTIKAIIWRITK